jgi:hypothetical protein
MHPVRMSRRQLLRGAGRTATGVVLAGVGVGVTGSGLLGPSVVSAAELTHDEMRKHVNTEFRVQTSALGATRLRLADVTDLTSPVSRTRKGQCFSMSFEGSANAAFPAATYTIEHDRVGQTMLFLSPVGRQGKVRNYEAIVNRIL